MVIYCDRIYMEDGIKDGFLEIRDGKFGKFFPKETEMKADLDYSGFRIIPGIVDTHNHGGFGVRINDGCTEEEVKLYLKGEASWGVTGVFPTTFQLKAMELVSRMAEEEQDGAQILGINSEGPWGARVGEKGVNTGYPKVDMEVARAMVQAGGKWLKLVCIAPEVEGAGKAVDYFLSQGITMSIYHTNANYAQANEAIDRGITVATHLGNVMTGLHHRDIGTMGACLLRDEVDCEVICDGMHVCNPMLDIIFRLKPHDKVMMVSDNVQYAGAPAGEYLRETQVENSDRNRIFVTEDGRVLSQSGRLSGSGRPVLYGMKNLVEQLHMPLEEVVRFSSWNPCRKYGYLDRKGSIREGKDGDFVVISDEFQAEATYCMGKCVYDRKRDRELFNQEFLRKYKVG